MNIITMEINNYYQKKKVNIYLFTIHENERKNEISTSIFNIWAKQSYVKLKLLWLLWLSLETPRLWFE